MSDWISVTNGDSVKDGGCNGCTESKYFGAQPKRIFVINLRSMSFRLCRKCFDDLMKKMKWDVS